MNFIRNDDDQSLLNPKLVKFKQKDKTRLFIDWAGHDIDQREDEESLPARYRLGGFTIFPL